MVFVFVQFISLSRITSRSIHVAVNDIISFFKIVIIVALQCCAIFCCTAKRISHMYICTHTHTLTYIYPLFFEFPFHVGHHRALGRVSCASGSSLFSSVIYFTYSISVCKSRKSRDTWSNRQVWPWSTKWRTAKANSILARECTGHSKHPFSHNTRDNFTHGHNQIVNTKIRLIASFVAKDGKTVYSQQKQDLELTVAQVISFS